MRFVYENLEHANHKLRSRTTVIYTASMNQELFFNVHIGRFQIHNKVITLRQTAKINERKQL